MSRVVHTTPRRPRTRLLHGFLGATLTLSALLAYHALDAARSHRETAEAALTDYASIAAWEFTRRARTQLSQAVWQLFEPIGQVFSVASPRFLPPLDGITNHTKAAACDCPKIKEPHTYFRLDVPTERFQTLPAAALPPSAARQLADTVLADVHAVPGRYIGMFAIPADDAPSSQIVVYRVIQNRRDGSPLAVYGAVANYDAFHELFARYCGDEALLPPAISGGQPNDSLLHISVITPSAQALYQSSTHYPDTFASTDTLGVGHGGLIVQAAIRPDAAARLLIGGLPRSRLPLTIGLILLTLGVGAATMVQVRREQELARLRDDFVSGVSHELRTPLAQIRMFSELLAENKLRTDHERNRSTDIIAREARRLTHLVENVLQFSRQHRGSARLTLQRVDVPELLRDTRDAFAPIAESHGMALAVTADGVLSADVDRDAVSQMLLNLLDNAVKYGPAGQTISLAAAREDGALVLTVSDGGPGVPERDRQRIFEPYRRLERHANTAITGSGIGLSVVSELAAQHGGSVTVDDAPGGGARFAIRLPQTAVPVPA